MCIVPAKSSQTDRVYRELRERLIRGDVPVGGRLVEQQLAAEFKTSRTPVREALRRLEGDGHLTRDPAGGLAPRMPSVRSMRELYDVRMAIEELVVRRAAVGDLGLMEALQQEWRGLQAEHRAAAAAGTGFVYRDEAFHDRIAEASGNGAAREFLRDVTERIRILRIHDFASEDRIRSTISEHLEIVDAVLAGDAESAAGFMRAHVQRSAQSVREQLGAVLARMFEEGGTNGATSGPHLSEGA